MDEFENGFNVNDTAEPENTSDSINEPSNFQDPTISEPTYFRDPTVNEPLFSEPEIIPDIPAEAPENVIPEVPQEAVPAVSGCDDLFALPPILTKLEGLDRESFWAEVGKAKPIRKKPKKILIVLSIIMFLMSVFILLTVIYGRGWFLRFLNGGKSIDFTLPIAETPRLEDAYYQADGRYTVEGIAKAISPSVVSIEVYTSDMMFVPSSQGSGIIMSSDGYILTNAHVIEGGKKLKVVLYNKAEYFAEVIGYDEYADIAVIKVAASDLSPAQFGDSDNVNLGEDVVAIGSPAGFYGSVTKGIVSGKNRMIKVESYSTPMRCIQIDAAINPGNSGGALLNMWGQVIGITSSKLTSKMYDGIGFAISLNSAKPVIEDIMSKANLDKRAKIGITYYAISEESAVMNGTKAGLFIVTIDSMCDVASTDLKPGDIITDLDGQSVSRSENVREIISAHSIGDTITAKVYRPDAETPNKGDYFDISFKLMADMGSLVEKKD